MPDVVIYSEDDFVQLRKAGSFTASCFDVIDQVIGVGVTTAQLNDAVHEYITQNGNIPACLGYHGFPASICTSVNHIVCHGIPGDKTLRNGDIINIDITCIVDGWYGDMSRMYMIGDVSARNRKLVERTKTYLDEAIAICRPGIRLSDIGEVIQRLATADKFTIVENFCGHGIGRKFHENPYIFHYKTDSAGKNPYSMAQDIELKKGMVFTIEPMINAGKVDVKILQDGWTVVTKDRKPSAQWEHTIGITDDGAEIFTVKTP